MDEIVAGNPNGFAKALANFAEPMVLLTLAAEILTNKDIKRDSDLAKKIIAYEQKLEGKITK